MLDDEFAEKLLHEIVKLEQAKPNGLVALRKIAKEERLEIVVGDEPALVLERLEGIGSPQLLFKCVGEVLV